MAKDYFQDITPPSGDQNPPHQFRPLPPEAGDHVEQAPAPARGVPIRITSTDEAEQGDGIAPPPPAMDPASRGIRSISPPPRPLRVAMPPSGVGPDIRGTQVRAGIRPRSPRPSGRLWMWAAASLVVVIGAALLLFLFGSTTISVTPKSRMATLTASPISARAIVSSETAVPGTLTYTVQSFDLEDSEVVEAKGPTTHVESKASGSITVYNAYSATPQRFIKNTRFETPDGLIFRAVSDIVVPGKKGSTAGQVSVTVVADHVGDKYNIGPVAKFTLPGLKGGSMYTSVYAKSSASMTGGASGEQLGTAPGALEAAMSLVRGRLEAKAREASVGQKKDGTLVFTDLIQITYESLPNTTEAGDSIRIHEKAHVQVPVFPADAFAQALAAAAAFPDTGGSSLRIVPQADFTVHPVEGIAEQPGMLTMVVNGSALIIWNVDAASLASALAGKDNSAFQGIVNGFSSIQEAYARIEPFWQSSFPSKASDIRINIIEPSAGK